MNDIEIIPALMPGDIEELAGYAREFKGLVRTVQIDVMDGKFVPERSWPYAGERDSFEAVVAQNEGLPLWKDLNYEADLMIASTEEDIGQWIQSGVERIIVHYEALKDPKGFFTQEAIADPVRKEFLEIGVALDIDTPEEKVVSFIESGAADFVQCMGIARIGYQGQPFDERVLPKVERLRKRFPELIISIDGGVSLESAGALARAGANRLISGSAILESINPKEAIEALRAAATS